MCDSDIWYMNEGQNYMLSERLSKAKEWRSGMWFTLGTLMTSAAADVINHNGRKIGRFKPIRFCYARMTSAQSWSRRHHCFGPTSSLPVFKRLYLDIYKTLAFTFLAQLKECQELYVWKNTSRQCMFTQQNRRGLNLPILRPLWLMAAADVISVPGVWLERVKFISMV